MRYIIMPRRFLVLVWIGAIAGSLSCSMATQSGADTPDGQMCGLPTNECYARIEAGMTFVQVRDLLGDPLERRPGDMICGPGGDMKCSGMPRYSEVWIYARFRVYFDRSELVARR